MALRVAYVLFCIGLAIRESVELCVIWLCVRCVSVCESIYTLEPESLWKYEPSWRIRENVPLNLLNRVEYPTALAT